MARPRLDAIAGLKVLCLAGIFLQHFGLQTLGLQQPFDIGARAVEVFFACSGVLSAYNHGLDYGLTIADCARSLTARLPRVWPLHTFALVLFVAIGLATGFSTPSQFTPQGMAMFVAMAEAWSPKLPFAGQYPGALWFLSALAFCWLFTPAIAWCARALSGRLGGVRRGGLAGFALFGAMGFCLEWIVRTSELMPLNLHSGPVVRLVQYASAFCLGVAFFGEGPAFGQGAPRRRLALAVVELGVVAVVVACWLGAFGDRWRSTHFVLVTLLVLVLCVQAGPVSLVLSAGPLLLASRIELEFYAFHLVGLLLAGDYGARALAPGIIGPHKQLALAVLFTVGLSLAWRWLDARARSSVKKVSK